MDRGEEGELGVAARVAAFLVLSSAAANVHNVRADGAKFALEKERRGSAAAAELRKRNPIVQACRDGANVCFRRNSDIPRQALNCRAKLIANPAPFCAWAVGMEPDSLQMRDLVDACDWGRTPLGSRAQWSASLETILQVVLSSPFPMFIVWGNERTLIYNDSYIQILGDLHPVALGQPFFEVWPTVREAVEPIIADALSGRGSYFENLRVELRRFGRLDEAWFTFSYGPIYEDSGSIPGALCVCVETTAQVRAEQRLSGERERLRQMFDQAPGFIAVLDGPDHVFAMANAAYFDLVGRDDVIGKAVAEALPEVAEQGFIDLLDSVYGSGEPFVGRAMPVRLVRSGAPMEQRFVDFVFQPMIGQNGRVSGIFVQGHDVTERKRFETRQQLLVGELNHRVKNTLAIVQSLAHQTFRRSASPADAIVHYEGRLEALATAHNLLTRESWTSASIQEVLSQALEPFCQPHRCELQGPDVRLPPQTAVGLTLAVHELATNASKYGAFSNDTGKLSVLWKVNSGDLDLVWREQGGPAVAPPTREGFGTRMIKRSLAAEFKGKVELHFEPSGVICRVSAPLPQVSEGSPPELC